MTVWGRGAVGGVEPEGAKGVLRALQRDKAVHERHPLELGRLSRAICTDLGCDLSGKRGRRQAEDRTQGTTEGLGSEQEAAKIIESGDAKELRNF